MDDADHQQASSAVPAPETHREAGIESPVHTFHLDSTGLRRMLGSLEADLMDAAWQLTSSHAAASDQAWTTVGSVCQHLGSGYHYKTVQTVMNRLVEKQLLIRRQRQRAFEYCAAITRDELVAQVTRTVVTGLVQDFGEVAIAQLVKTLHDVTPDHLALLEHLAATAPGAAASGDVEAERGHTAPDGMKGSQQQPQPKQQEGGIRR